MRNIGGSWLDAPLLPRSHPHSLHTQHHDTICPRTQTQALLGAIAARPELSEAKARAALAALVEMPPEQLQTLGGGSGGSGGGGGGGLAAHPGTDRLLRALAALAWRWDAAGALACLESFARLALFAAGPEVAGASCRGGAAVL